MSFFTYALGGGAFSVRIRGCAAFRAAAASCRRVRVVIALIAVTRLAFDWSKQEADPCLKGVATDELSVSTPRE